MSKSRFVNSENGWPTIDVGALRHFVTILASSPSQTFDAAGPVSTYQPFTTGWAAIDAVRGLDVIRSGQTTAELYLEICMWFQPGITPAMRIQHSNGSIYIVQSIENVLEMDTVLVFNCVGLNANN